MTPLIFEQGLQGERAYDIYSWLLQRNTIYLSGEISRETADIVCAQIMAKELENAAHVNLFINSPGGSVNGLMSIIDTIRCSNVAVHTYCVGASASAAAVLLTCGEPGHRYIYPSASVMFHDISSITHGTYRDMKIDMEQTEHLRRLVQKVLAENLNMTYSEVEQTLMDRDKWFTAEEAIEIGAADMIVDKLDVK